MFWLRNKKIIFFGTHSYFVVIGASRVKIDPVILTTCKIVNIFLPISFNISFGFSIEPSH